MAGRRRSGFANDKRGYGCAIPCSPTQIAPPPPNYTAATNTSVTVGSFLIKIGNNLVLVF